MAEVFDRIPQEAKSLRQYAPVIAIYKTKVSLLKAGISTGFEQVFVIKENGISVDTSVYDPFALWECASKLRLEDAVFSDMVSKIQRNVTLHIPTCRSFHSSDTKITVIPGDVPTDSSVVSTATISLLQLLSRFVPLHVYSEFSRKLWAPLAHRLVKSSGGFSAPLADLETSLVHQGLIPVDIPRTLATGWEKAQSNQLQSMISSNLAKVRSRLLADINRKSVHLPVSAMTESAFLPREVSQEAVWIAKEYLENISGSKEMVGKIIALFTTIRQSQFTDPKGINPRNAAIFFNDCLYFTVALALSEKIDFSPEIVMLRAVASRSMSAFTSAVAARAIGHLTAITDRAWSLGLSNNQQVNIAESTVAHAVSEMTACIREWQAVHVQPDLMQIWTLMILDPLLKEMNRLTVLCAKSAVNLSRKSGGILGSATSPVISAIWSVYRKFVQLLEDEVLSSNQLIEALSSWAAAKATRTALCGNHSDILSCEPIAHDEDLSGVSREGIDWLLACNPLLQGDSKESIKSLGDSLILTVAEEPIRKLSAGEKDFTSLFNRA